MPERDHAAASNVEEQASLTPAQESVRAAQADGATDPGKEECGRASLAIPRVERYLTALAALSCGVAVCCNAWYIFVTFRTLFHSDAAMKVLLAEEIARTRSLFPPTWYYENDFPILFPHVFVLLYRIILSNYLAQHAAAIYTAVLLFSASVWLLGRELRLRPVYAFLVQAILLSGGSHFFAQVLFGEGSYLMLATAIIFLAYFIVSINSGRAGRARKRSVRFLCVVGLVGLVGLAVAGGVRGILTISAPMTIAAALFLLLETQFLSKRNLNLVGASAMVIGAILLGTMLGFACNRFLVHSRQIAFPTFLAFAPFDRIGHNLVVLLQGWLIGGGALADAGRVPNYISAVRVALRFCATLFVTFLPWILLFQYRKLSSRGLRFTLLLFSATCFVTLYFYLFGTVAPDWPAFRYFTVPYVLCVIIAIAFCEEMSRRYGTGFTVLTLPICIVLIGFSCADLVYPAFPATGIPSAALPSSDSQNAKQAIVEAATKEGLTFGYASYWNASVVTVLSSARVRVLPVHILPGAGVVPMRYLGSEWWYRSEAHHGPVFVFVTSEELQTVEGAFFFDIIGPPQRVISVAGGSLLVFAENLATRIPWWAPQRQLNKALPASDRKALVESLDNEITTKPDGRGVIPVRITNLGKSVFAWGGDYPVAIGAHLKSEDGKMITYDFVQAPLPAEVPPGRSALALVRFKIPSPGLYVLNVDLLQAGVAWFVGEGSRDVTVKVIYPSVAAFPGAQE